MPDSRMMKDLESARRIAEFYNPTYRTFHYNGDAMTLSDCKEYYSYIKREGITKGRIITNGTDHYWIVGASFRDLYLYGLVGIKVGLSKIRKNVCKVYDIDELKTLDLNFIKSYHCIKGYFKPNINLSFIKKYTANFNEFLSALELLSSLSIGDVLMRNNIVHDTLYVITDLKENIKDIEVVSLSLYTMREKYDVNYMSDYPCGEENNSFLTQAVVESYMRENVTNLKIALLKGLYRLQLNQLYKIYHLESVQDTEFSLFVTKLKLLRG